MQQILNITQTRNNLSKVIKDVSKSNKSVVIIRDSVPEAVILSYSEYISSEKDKDLLWQAKFEKLLRQGKKVFRTWAKKNKVDINKLNEEDVYDIIQKA